jgi:NAD(P)H dehydrogenase (quinone)
MILVTGASGAVGGRVARLLAGQGQSLRLLVRDSTRAPKLLGAEVVTGDYADPASLPAAFAGIDTAFIVSGYAQPGERWKLHANAVDAARAAGVGRIVYLSFQGAAPDSAFSFARDHAQTEEHIRFSGIPYTFLRPDLYLDEVPHFFGDDGIVRGPAGEGRAAWVSRDDLAAVLANVLTQGGHENAAYDVTGPEALSLSETADRLSALVGRRLSYEPETREEGLAWRSTLGAPDWEVDAWVSSYEAIAAGELAPVSDTVPRITGSPATSLEQFFTREPKAIEMLAKRLK